jgi:hypothetical protein
VGVSLSLSLSSAEAVPRPSSTRPPQQERIKSPLASSADPLHQHADKLPVPLHIRESIYGMEAVLAKFAAMGLDMMPKILSCAIIGKITQKRPALTSFFVGASVSTMLVKKVHSPNRRPVEEHAGKVLHARREECV